jgi:competence protein ComEC
MRSRAIPDLRLLAPSAAAWLAAAVSLQERRLRPVLVVAALLALLALIILVTGRRAGAVAAAALLVGSASAASAALHAAAARHGPVATLAGRSATVTARLVVTGDPQWRRSHTGRWYALLSARVTSVDDRSTAVAAAAPVLVIGSDPSWRALTPSQHLTASGRLSPARSGDLLAGVLLARAPPREVTPPSTMQASAARVRAGLRTSAGVLPADEAGLLPGLAVGDTSRLPDRLQNDFRIVGMTHLVAVSGENLAILLGAVLALLRSLRLGPRLAPLAAGLALIGFVILVRPSPSVLRAAVMGTVGMSALASGRGASAFPALGAAVLLLVLVQPGLAVSWGFALSVAATAGLLVVAPGWRSRIARRLPSWLPPSVAEAVAVSAAAQLACAPLIAAMAGSVSLMAVPANLAAAPAVAPATVLGMLSAVLGPLWAPPAQVFAWAAGVPTAWLALVAHTGARLPLASLSWPSGWVGGGLLALLTIGAAAVVRSRYVRRVAVLAVLLAIPAWLLMGQLAS